MSDSGTTFQKQFEAVLPRLKRYTRSLTRSADTADDLFQDVVTIAWRKQHLWQPGTDLRAWLFTITHNQHVSNIRKDVRSGKPVNIEEIQESGLAVTAHQTSRLQLRDMERALAKLPEEMRQPILLIGVEGLSYEEAADVLNVPVGTVRSRISRGRETLRQLMEDKEIPDKEALAVFNKRTEDRQAALNAPHAAQELQGAGRILTAVN